MDYKKNINGILALGYGSKYQLLRMLGWHRSDFSAKVKNALKLESDIRWLDFLYDGPCDKELLNLQFEPELDRAWKSYWSCGAGGINWDAVGVADDGTYILVEAKAHLAEMKNSFSGVGQARENNTQKIAEFIKKHKINATAEDWLTDYYQLANRLVITDFLQEKGCRVRLLYVLFENGYEYNRDRSDSASAAEWNNEMERELREMGVKGTSAESLISWCVIDCNPK